MGGQHSRVWAEIKSNTYSIGNSVTHARKSRGRGVNRRTFNLTLVKSEKVVTRRIPMAARSQTGPPGSGCEAHWILVLSTGRSGSTTILQMLNAVPFIELAGELTNTNTGRDTAHDGQNCWRACTEKAGACSWCGPRGACCRRGDADSNSCQWWQGCDGWHCCVLRSNFSIPRSSWYTN